VTRIHLTPVTMNGTSSGPRSPLSRRVGRGLTAATVAGLAASALATSAAGPASAAPSLAPLIGPSGTSVSAAAATAVSPATVVKDSYIVALKDAAGVKAAAARGAALGGQVTQTYGAVLPGYAVTLTGSELAAVRADPAVKYVQQELRYSATGSTQKQPASWGLDRIDQRNRPLNKGYYYTGTGRGVSVYIVDDGVFAEHPDFEGRVVAGDDEIGNTDGRLGRVNCDGHGTHVAGTVGGKYFGVAKRVTLVPVRVLDCQGNGSEAEILAGLDWVRANHTANSVVNMSLGTASGVSVALNDAVQQLTDAGITVVVAAGNGDASGRGISACTVSPASAPSALTVGASTSTDRAATFSNYGACVDLYAPGVGILSDWNQVSGSNYTIVELDGTSQASPHVAGAAALYLERHPGASPAQVTAAIKGASTKNKIGGVNPKFPHDLLFSVQPVALPAGVTTGDRLRPGQNLLRGARLYSANRAYFLAHRARDGWLCLYNAASGKVVWSTGHSAAWTNMNASGSLVSYDSYGRRSYTTNTPVGTATMIVNGKGYLQLVHAGKTYWTSPH
jgi:subtilisin family serine protease